MRQRHDAAVIKLDGGCKVLHQIHFLFQNEPNVLARTRRNVCGLNK